MKFQDLSIGDMFNTKTARYVKIDEHRAIVVMSSVLDIGDLIYFHKDDDDIVVLYSRSSDDRNMRFEEECWRAYKAGHSRSLRDMLVDCHQVLQDILRTKAKMEYLE